MDEEFGKDITPILAGWDYKPDEVSVRKIIGLDGRVKIQMRLPMGLIQMEIEGRPDGQRPQNYESWLEYYEARYKENPENFSLDPDDCARLRDEAVMYYQRYLSLFTLRDFERVMRDTLRNLRVLDFVKAHADDTGDRLSLEQYRPYLIMMYTRAAAHHYLDRQLRGKALNEVRKGIAAIEEFFGEIGREELAARSPELNVLRQLETEIKEQIPEAKIEDLRAAMQEAVANEDYERAAQLRDEIRRIETKSG
ncbi:MAG: UvrB/UvrC motif-containing protein [Candidatus Sumerlaeia bacterium]|nr:UvrB/UvrC motif-containing protein [Candidatus Sumerlaeia bacterium]